MSIIQYSIWNPNGNITALVSSKIESSKRVFVADEIMKKEPTVEQVGFLSLGEQEYDIQLNMAGGEFCGNATLCAACTILDKEKVVVKVSGTADPVTIFVNQQQDQYITSAKMPIPLSKQKVFLSYDNNQYPAFLVDFGSIKHYILSSDVQISNIEQAMKQWCNEETADAIGILFYDEQKNTLRPIVYVKKANTYFVENSCASGTTAIGHYLLSKKMDNMDVSIQQPGGIITVLLENGNVTLKETIKRVKEKVIEI